MHGPVRFEQTGRNVMRKHFRWQLTLTVHHRHCNGSSSSNKTTATVRCAFGRVQICRFGRRNPVDKPTVADVTIRTRISDVGSDGHVSIACGELGWFFGRDSVVWSQPLDAEIGISDALDESDIVESLVEICEPKIDGKWRLRCVSSTAYASNSRGMSCRRRCGSAPRSVVWPSPSRSAAIPSGSTRRPNRPARPTRRRITAASGRRKPPHLPIQVPCSKRNPTGSIAFVRAFYSSRSKDLPSANLEFSPFCSQFFLLFRWFDIFSPSKRVAMES